MACNSEMNADVQSWRDLSWSDLAIFLAAAETGSLTRAAEELGISQPTASRRIDALEAALGVPVFVRSRQGLRLTALGETILDNVRHMAEDAQAVARAARSRNQALSGRVTVSLSEGMADIWLTRHLSGFYERYPEIVLEIRVEHRAADLLAGEADIAVRMFRPVEPPLIARRTARVGFGLFAAPDYLERHGRPTSLEDLAHHRLIWTNAVSEAMKARCFHDLVSLPGRRRLVTDSMHLAISATRQGIGIGLHPVLWARNIAGLEQILPDRVCGEVEAWLVTHEELRSSARIRAVFDFLAEKMEEDAAYMTGRREPPTVRGRRPQATAA